MSFLLLFRPTAGSGPAPSTGGIFGDEMIYKFEVKKGSTGVLIHFYVMDTSSTTGDGLTGLAYNTGSLSAYYIRPGETGVTQITLVDSTVGVWASGGLKEVSSSAMPGVYEFGVPDQCLIAGADSCLLMFKGASDMRQTLIDIRLTDNLESDTYGVISDYNQLRKDLGITRLEADIQRIKLDSGALRKTVNV